MAADQSPDPRRWWALGALAVALLALGLDVTILNVALPTLAVDLEASTGELQWFANAYTLVLAAGLLPAGLLGDKFGTKKLLIGAMALFGAASVACAYAGTAELLIAARALLGVGAAFLIPLSMSVLTVLFPGKERAKAIAVWSAAMAVGIPLGPVVGGWLLDNFWWGSVFLVNLPFVAVGVVLLAWLLPDVPGRRGQRIDYVGIVLSVAGLAALTYGLVEAGEQGWGSVEALLPIFAGLAVLAAFVAWLRRVRYPLVELSLFRSAGFTWGAVLATVASFALMGAMFVLPQFFQAVGGTDALETGLRLLPVVGGLIVGVPIADRLRAAFGAKVVVAAGFVIMAAGLALGTTTEVSDGYGFVAVWVSVIGIGLGFTLPPSMDVAMGALRSERSGVGSGMLQAMRQVGGTLGVAILGTVLAASYRAGVDTAGIPAKAAAAVEDTAAAGVSVADQLGSPVLLTSVREAFVGGMTSTLWVCAGVAVVGAVLTLAFLPPRPEDVGEAESEYDYVAG
ncbi:multidrug MFS transporter [Prauserella marina]|uniref:Drug resistance transporter, EmrB/QacA subfamily n=1 Tax=Prauserella marina TaxID=530584 RepID=A0A222VWW7_9PSEU|nr:DHA2 family efflux MFS transporter permease subunit [Prauserella marina]ASR38429.1 multidrug MFS transporter [Prauserella marina]PWV78335.1 EmrB/QacA subfamily drug resistance transporter [Prauserella marina]SDC83677.1 drug resistance transporter, EmrB/QacA subfamily [Prauserella marina]